MCILSSIFTPCPSYSIHYVYDSLSLSPSLSFSLSRLKYDHNDCDWFLKLANCQQEWRASDQLLSEVVISSSYSGDLVTAMESSLKRSRYRPHIEADIPPGCVSIFVFKMYLSRILGVCVQQVEQGIDGTSTTPPDLANSGPLLMYLPEVSIVVI